MRSPSSGSSSAYYPASPAMFEAWMRSFPPLAAGYGGAAAHQSSHHSLAAAYHSQTNQHSPKAASRAVSHHLSPQQQTPRTHIQIPPHSQAHGVAPGFLEYARKRQHDQFRQEYKYESIQHEQLRQNAAIAQLQSQRHHQASPRDQRHTDSLHHQQESTAAVLASMRTHQPTIASQAASHAAQMKMIPRAHGGMPSEALSAEQDAARMAMEASRKDPNTATAAAYLGHLAHPNDGHLYPAHPQPQRTPPAPQPYQEQPKSNGARQPPKPVAHSTSEDVSLDENGAGAKLLVKRMITTSEESPLTTGMDKLEVLPMLPYTPPDANKEHPVREQEITSCDVLVGGKHCTCFRLVSSI